MASVVVEGVGAEVHRGEDEVAEVSPEEVEVDSREEGVGELLEVEALAPVEAHHGEDQAASRGVGVSVGVDGVVTEGSAYYRRAFEESCITRSLLMRMGN